MIPQLDLSPWLFGSNFIDNGKQLMCVRTLESHTGVAKGLGVCVFSYAPFQDKSSRALHHELCMMALSSRDLEKTSVTSTKAGENGPDGC